MEVELSKNWINKSLNELMANNELSYRHLDPFYNSLTDLFKQKINNKLEINVSEFLIACIGSFIFYDLKQRKYSPSIFLPERSTGVEYYRPLNYLDIEEAKKLFGELLDGLLEKISLHCALSDKQTTFSCFELIDKLQRTGKFDLYISRYRMGYFVSDIEPRVTTEQKISLGVVNVIPEDFIRHIFYEYYGLDHNIAKDGLPLVTKYNAGEAAKSLGISKYNLIKECLDASLGVYINSGQFKIRSMEASNQYNKEIIEVFSDVTYPYNYRGLVRLSKLTLEALYSGEVTVNDKPIRLQPSLTEAIQKRSLHIDLRGDQRITINDLFFVEDEILTVQSFLKETPKTEVTAIADERIGGLDNVSLRTALDSNEEKQQRSHGLRDLIKEIFVKNRAISNPNMWSELSKEAKRNLLIKHVSSWSAYDSYIKWVSQDHIESKMSKSTFQKYMSSLRHPK